MTSASICATGFAPVELALVLDVALDKKRDPVALVGGELVPRLELGEHGLRLRIVDAGGDRSRTVALAIARQVIRSRTSDVTLAQLRAR